MRKTYEYKEAIKLLIEEKAIEVFSKKGYNSTNMQDIADAVGISRGPLYYHYKNKIDLYNHVAEIYILNETMRYKNIFEQNSSIFEKIYNDLICCTEGSVRRFFMDSYLYEELTYAKNKFIDFLNWIYQLKLENINEAIKNGHLKRDTDGKIIVDLIFIFYNGIVQMVDDDFYKNHEIKVETCINSFIEGLKNTYEKKWNLRYNNKCTYIIYVHLNY